MKILLQNNIWQEYAYDGFVQSCYDHADQVEMVDIIPFTEDFVSKPSSVPDFIFGSARMVDVCRKHGFHTFPSFAPIELDLFPRELWINGDGYSTTWGDFETDTPVFIKPFREKFFTGVVVESTADKEKVQLATSFVNDERLEKIWVSPCKKIDREVRLFVINGEIVTGSTYKINGAGNHQKIDYNDEAYKFAKEILGFWRHDGTLSVKTIDIDGFVLDIGKVDNNWYIVELNNMNSAGFYRCDTDAIIRYLHFLMK